MVVQRAEKLLLKGGFDALTPSDSTQARLEDAMATRFGSSSSRDEKGIGLHSSQHASELNVLEGQWIEEDEKTTKHVMSGPRGRRSSEIGDLNALQAQWEDEPSSESRFRSEKKRGASQKIEPQRDLNYLLTSGGRIGDDGYSKAPPPAFAQALKCYVCANTSIQKYSGLEKGHKNSGCRKIIVSSSNNNIICSSSSCSSSSCSSSSCSSSSCTAVHATAVYAAANATECHVATVWIDGYGTSELGS